MPIDDLGKVIGFSPTVTVEVDTPDEYKLKFFDGTYTTITPNLRGCTGCQFHIEDGDGEETDPIEPDEPEEPDPNEHECLCEHCGEPINLEALKGFSPMVTVVEDTEESYVLSIQDATHTIVTPNLRSCTHPISAPIEIKIVETDTCITFSSANTFSIATYNKLKNWDGTLEYLNNEGSWSIWNGTAAINAVLLNGRYKLYMRGINNTVIAGNSTSYRWVLTGNNIKCEGNIENLLDYFQVSFGIHPNMGNYCYAHMFRGCTELTTAPALPATTLEINCYREMFYNCTGLTAAPSLSAKTMKKYCYQNMFYNCTELTTAPALPATTLEISCYQNMFCNCTGLKVSATRTGGYTKEWRIPKDGIISDAPSSWSTKMIDNTGGTFKSDPSINTTYYVENDPT